MTSPAEAGQLRRALDDFADTMPVGPVDVTAVVRASHRRRSRRRIAGAAMGAVLLGPAAYAFLPDTGTAPRTAGHVRILAPDERVTVYGTTQVWLTADGGFCRQDDPTSAASCTPVSGAPRYVRISDVLVPADTRSVTLTGTFSAPGTAVGVRVRQGEATAEGTVLTLAGDPGWGAWFADVPLNTTAGVTDVVSVYDPARRTIVGATESAPVWSPPTAPPAPSGLRRPAP
jgi:hypothetical protein